MEVVIFMQVQAALLDVVICKLARNPTKENISSVYNSNESLFRELGLDWDLQFRLKMMTENVLGQAYYTDIDPNLYIGPLSQTDIDLINTFSQPRVTVENIEKFYLNEDRQVVTYMGQVCEVYAIRVTFGHKFAPILVPIAEVDKVREHRFKLGISTDECIESLYFQMTERFGTRGKIWDFTYL